MQAIGFRRGGQTSNVVKGEGWLIGRLRTCMEKSSGDRNWALERRRGLQREQDSQTAKLASTAELRKVESPTPSPAEERRSSPSNAIRGHHPSSSAMPACIPSHHHPASSIPPQFASPFSLILPSQCQTQAITMPMGCLARCSGCAACHQYR